MYERLAFRIGDKKIEISLLDLMVVLYFCRSSLVNFATAVGISTYIVAGLVLIPFSVIFVYYFITHLGEIKWDAIILYIHL